MATTTITIKIQTMAEPPILTWPEKYYTLHQIRELLRVVESNIENFDKLREPERAALEADLHILNAAIAPAHFSMQQAVSARNLAAVVKNIVAHQRKVDLGSYFQTYMQLRDNNHTEIVQRASRIYQLPPRAVLAEYAKFQFAPKFDYKKVLTGRIDSDLEPAIKWANEHDAESPQNKAQSTREGELYERLLEDYLRDRGYKFRTQSEITEQQKAETGQVYATPDILFAEPVQLQVGSTTETIYWMDAKSYLYVPLVESRDDLPKLETPKYQPSYIDTKLAEQASKYQKHFGAGAFVFAHGYMQSTGPQGLYSQHLRLGDTKCILLSGEHIKSKVPHRI